jgi:hypothetical protein
VGVAKKTTTSHQRNYLNNDGDEIDSGRHRASLAKDMIGEQRRQGVGGGATTTVAFLERSSNKKK